MLTGGGGGGFGVPPLLCCRLLECPPLALPLPLWDINRRTLSLVAKVLARTLLAGGGDGGDDGSDMYHI